MGPVYQSRTCGLVTSSFSFFLKKLKKLGGFSLGNKRTKIQCNPCKGFFVKKMCPKSPEFEEKSWLIPLVDDCQYGYMTSGPQPLGFWYHQKSLDKIDLLLLLLCNFQTSQEKVSEFKVFVLSENELLKIKKTIFSQRTLMLLSPF